MGILLTIGPDFTKDDALERDVEGARPTIFLPYHAGTDKRAAAPCYDNGVTIAETARGLKERLFRPFAKSIQHHLVGHGAAMETGRKTRNTCLITHQAMVSGLVPQRTSADRTPP